MVRPLRLATTTTASTTLRPDPRRRSQAEAWLEQVLGAWGLEPALGGRWLAPADTHLRAAGDVTLSAEFDVEMQIFSFEIWQGQHRIYGLDDWLG